MTLCDSCSPRKQCMADKSRTECKYYQPMTNEEWIKSANTERLEEWIDNITDSCYMCGSNPQNYRNCPFGKCIDKKGCAIEWLKQPHAEKE